MNKDISEYKDIIKNLEFSEKNLKFSLDKLQKECIILRKDTTEFEEARNIVNTVLSATQDSVKEYIEEVATLAMQTVFGDDYSLKIEFEQKRGKSEANLIIKKGGLELDPRHEVGGGVIDTLSLGLRLCIWSLRGDNRIKCFILDECAKHLSSELRPKFGKLLKKFSEMFGVQILMISHDRQVLDNADKIFNVIQQNGVSKVGIIN